MLKARDIMTRKVISVSPETEVTKAAKILLDNSVNGMPVVDSEGRLVGIICQSDLIAQQKQLPLPSVFTLLDGVIPLFSQKNLESEAQKIMATTVFKAMTPDPVTISPESSLEEIAKLMVDKKLHTLPVIKQGKLIGIVGKEDVLRTIFSGED
ncbi:MAG: CBS domain-containing protein [Deltaproteobacteria bacterium]|jgi:CBS-domain-containing membrane protein|nr:MAG: CBS domain-containing protein [Deltaproteobacteria bacterium]